MSYDFSVAHLNSARRCPDVHEAQPVPRRDVIHTETSPREGSPCSEGVPWHMPKSKETRGVSESPRNSAQKLRDQGNSVGEWLGLPGRLVGEGTVVCISGFLFTVLK